MTPAKAQRLESALNTVARQILDAVPIQEAWGKTQIADTLVRQGKTINGKVIDGVIENLPDRGLIKRVGLNFTRTPIRYPDLKAVETIKEPDMPQEPDAVALMFAQANALRSMADEVEAAAELLRESLAQLAKDNAQLTALKAILKDMK